jgi:tight adherence protein C
MTFLILSSSALAFLLIMILFSSTVEAEFIKRRRINAIKGGTSYLDEELEKDFYQRYFEPVLKRLKKGIDKKNKTPGSGAAKSKGIVKVQNELLLAGIHVSAEAFSIIKMAITLGLAVLGLVLALTVKSEPMVKLLIMTATLMLAILIPRYYLKSRIKSRQTAIRNQLPNLMDVLSVSIEAGLGFDAALLKVTENFKGPLVDEFSRVYREIQMGKSRRDALLALAERSNVEELKTFTSAVVQSEKYGTPVKNVMKAQSQQLRLTRRQRAQEKAAKAPVKMLLPMVVFVFPVVFIILMGPTVINMIDQFG